MVERYTRDKIWNDSFDPTNKQIRIRPGALPVGTNPNKYSIDEILNRVFDPTNKQIRISPITKIGNGTDYVEVDSAAKKINFYLGNIKVGELDSNGNFRIRGEISVLQTL